MMRARAQCEFKCVCLLVMLAKGEEGTGASYRSLAQDSSPAFLAHRHGYLFLFLRKVLPDTHVL